jgi:hypothetical protein
MHFPVVEQKPQPAVFVQSKQLFLSLQVSGGHVPTSSMSSLFEVFSLPVSILAEFSAIPDPGGGHIALGFIDPVVVPATQLPNMFQSAVTTARSIHVFVVAHQPHADAPAQVVHVLNSAQDSPPH